MAHDVFISHANRDKATADAACAALENAGIRCWIAPRDVRPGRSFAGEITRAIQQGKVMVLVFSTHSNDSDQVLREVQLATEANLHILQMRIEDVRLNDDLKYYLSTPHWLDALTPPLEKHLGRLVVAIKSLLGQSEPLKEEKLSAAPLTPTTPQKPENAAASIAATSKEGPTSKRKISSGKRIRLTLLLLLLGALAAGSWITVHELRKLAPSTRPSAGAVTQHAPEGPTGTLAVQTLAVQTKGTTHWFRVFEGWLYVDHELKGKLPMNRQFSLAPGAHEIRYIFFTEKNEDYELRFESFVKRIAVKQASTESCTIYFPTDERINGWEFGGESTAVSCTARASFTQVPSIKQVSDYAKELDDDWQKFERSAVWRVIESASTIVRTAPPSRNALFIDLPDDLGGAREMGADQFQRLRDWVLGFLCDTCRPRPMDIRGQNDPNVGSLVETLNAHYEERRQSVVATLDEIDKALLSASGK